MALSHDSVVELLETLPANSYRKYLSNTPTKLTDEMASALGSTKRQPIRILQAVVEAITNKLFIQTIASNDTSVDTVVHQWLSQNSWDTLEGQIWEAVVRDGTTYVLVGFDEGPVLYQLDAFDGKTGAGLTPDFGFNTWYEDEFRYLDLYYPDRIENYFYNGDSWVSLGALDWTDDSGSLEVPGNPIGIPLIPFSIGGSDLANGAVQLQSDIDEALLDLLSISRTQGFPLRSLKGARSLEYVTNSYGQPLYNTMGMPIKRTIKIVPGAIMPLGENEELMQLNAAAPDSTVLDKLLHLLTTITTVPMHYFSGDWPSGVALIQAEQRLNTLVEKHQAFLTGNFITLLRFMLHLNNIFGVAQYSEEAQLDIEWYPPQIETEDLRLDKLTQTSQAIMTLKGAGVISLEQSIRMLHEDWDEQQIQEEITRIRAERSAQTGVSL